MHDFPMVDISACSRPGELSACTEQEDGNVYAVETGEAGRLILIFWAIRGFG